ncbi:MAG TPA: Ig-like domain-containing protein [Thermoanaerobaculia bacterium]|nr:Ig-like domain-containing protein [Thermoanaerobaculia bacterium]
MLGILAVAAVITFISPQPGSQAVGILPIEVTANIAAVNRVEFFVDGAMVGVARQAPYRILHDFGTSLAGHDVVAKVYSNNFKNVEVAQIATAAMTAGETLHVDLVEVPMRVRSSHPLRVEDLRITENRIEQTISDVRSDRGPARFVFVVDRSLSMGDGKLTSALRAIDEESKLLRSDDRMEVVLFNHNVMPARAIARGEEVEAIFGSIPPSGGTSLRDAVSSIASRDRTYAIVITDGGDRNSMAGEEEALRKVSGTRLILDAILLGNSSRFLDRAAKNTGGTIARASASSVQRQLHRMILDINSRYTVAYQSHGNPSGWRSINVSARRPGIEIVNARKGYFAE